MGEPVTAIRIPRAEVRDNPSRHVVYQVSVTGPVRAWTVYRRYSEFEGLSSAWLTLFPHAPPPYPLPPKTIISLFGFTTSSDPTKIEERRRGLEQFLMAVLESRDDRWRKSKEWADFLGIPDTARRSLSEGMLGMSNSNSSSSLDGGPSPTEAWMDEYRRLQSLCREVRAIAATRDRSAVSGDTVAAQSAIIQAKKAVASLQSSITNLQEQLKELDRNLEREKAKPTNGRISITKGEIERRNDLLLNLQNEHERLIKLFSHSLSSTDLGSSSSINGTPGSRASSNTITSGTASISSRSGRKFGNIVAKETEVTRSLDNQGLLVLQKTTMNEQDEALEVLSKIVKRQQQIGLAIGQELDLQNQLLEDLDEGVTKVSDNLKISSKKLDYVAGRK
ncbi:Phox homologous domain-containing protein [Chytridium lagenaria]|nr:Phox homologous domain-containing protein [Chytridium lagenaria]